MHTTTAGTASVHKSGVDLRSLENQESYIEPFKSIALVNEE